MGRIVFEKKWLHMVLKVQFYYMLLLKTLD